MSKGTPFKAGHLRLGALDLPHKTAEQYRKGAYKGRALEKLKPITLDWKTSGAGGKTSL